MPIDLYHFCFTEWYVVCVLKHLFHFSLITLYICLFSCPCVCPVLQHILGKLLKQCPVIVGYIIDRLVSQQMSG